MCWFSCVGSSGSRSQNEQIRADGSQTTDIDYIKNGVLVEQKAASWTVDNTKWVDKHIYGKFSKDIGARARMRGYERAPIAFAFTTGKQVDKAFKKAVQGSVKATQERA